MPDGLSSRRAPIVGRDTVSQDFLEAYDEHVERVFGYLAYRLSSRADAEDLTQATFERAYRNWDRFDPSKASIKRWLMSIAHNALVDHSRRKGSRPRERDLDALTERGMEPTHEPELGTGVGAELEAALGRLSLREREVIALHFGGDLKGRQIAAILGLRTDNVHQILSRAQRKLRAQLEGSSDDRSGRRSPKPRAAEGQGPDALRPDGA